ncbi:DUF5988 family protein [Nonomuraea sp. NPDC050643]|uniref:DUF5988 family protein n=1 Tax=Nonomuraea sp. NPDC050643 TaxID=3155660 RepID=UPI0033D7B165
MNWLSGRTGEASTIDVTLVGGPADLPETTRTRRVDDVGDTKIKIPHRGGYEHFELVEAVHDGGRTAPLVFQWTMRTKIAE